MRLSDPACGSVPSAWGCWVQQGSGAWKAARAFLPGRSVTAQSAHQQGAATSAQTLGHWILVSSGIVFLFLKTYLLESQSYRGREGKRERRIFHRIGSFPKCLQHQDRARLKSGCRSFPHEFREPKHCFFQANNREMDMKWNSQDMNWHP